MKKLVIIPAYNESAGILRFVRELEAKVPDYDYIVINDCSRDATAAILREHGIPTIHLPSNLGIGGAVQTGYRYALKHGYEIAVQMDGDGQHDPAWLHKMEALLTEGEADLVIGSRFLKKEGFQSSGLRRAGIRYFTSLIRFLTGAVITDPTSGQRMAGLKVITSFALDYPEDYPEPESVTRLLRQGYRVKEIPVTMRERAGGVSSISMSKSIYYMIKVTMAIVIERLRRDPA